jgi:hypothetical protein
MLAFSRRFPVFLQATASQMHAKALASGDTWKATLIERLATDGRMDGIWNELSKHSRSDYKPTHEYFYAARPPEHFAPAPAQDLQSKAIQELFIRIVIATDYARHVRTQSGLLIEIENRLGQDALLLKQVGSSRRITAAADKLLKAAEVYSSLSKPESDRDLGIEIAEILGERFRAAPGKDFGMYGITARILSVALGKTITKAAVRGWCSNTVSQNGKNFQFSSHC